MNFSVLNVLSCRLHFWDGLFCDSLYNFLTQVSCTQWLKFGRREVASKRYDKAVMCLGLSLTLADSTTEKTVRCEANSLLSESRFQLNEFEKCLQAGEKCFKLKPTKSEVQVCNTCWAHLCACSSSYFAAGSRFFKTRLA